MEEFADAARDVPSRAYLVVALLRVRWNVIAFSLFSTFHLVFDEISTSSDAALRQNGLVDSALWMDLASPSDGAIIA
jgi:hypothetical protein